MNCDFKDFADCSEGIETSDDLVQICFSLFNGLGQLPRPEAAPDSRRYPETEEQPERRGVLHERHERHSEHPSRPVKAPLATSRIERGNGFSGE